MLDIKFIRENPEIIKKAVQDRQMSKSLDNGIDPIEMSEKFGTDALRLSLIIGSAPGADLRVYEEKIAGYRNFVNKLWNISRFIFTSVENIKTVKISLMPKKYYGLI